MEDDDPLTEAPGSEAASKPRRPGWSEWPGHLLDLPDTVANRVREFEWVDDVGVRLREEGHVVCGDLVVVACDEREPLERRESLVRAVLDLDWRLHEITVQFVRTLDSSGEDAGAGVTSGREGDGADDPESRA